MSSTQSGIEAEGIEEATAMFAGIVKRLEYMPGAKKPMTEAMEAAYRERFARFPKGYMVDSGATRNSLTRTSAPGAIRAAHTTVFRFGTTVPWAQYHAKALLRVTPSMMIALGESLVGYYVGENEPGRSPLSDAHG